MAASVQAATGDRVELAGVDHGDTGAEPAAAVASHGMRLAVVRLPGAKRGCVPLPRCWAVELGVAWWSCFHRLTGSDERSPAMVAGLHGVTCA